MGCHLLATVDRSDIEDGSSTTEGQGGTGGTGGVGGQGGAGGAGGTAECGKADECPGTDTDCQTRTCSDGVCGFDYAPSGTSTMGQTPGDCLESVCDGKGGLSSVNKDDDILDDMNPCTADTCNAGTPQNAPVMAGAACSGAGAETLCDGKGACVECIAAADCASQVCMSNQCVAATCADTVKNGAETDTDCGGPDCADCADGEACAGAGDCASGVCSGATCQAATCSDKVKNGPETDVDCGGPACGPCAPGLGCSLDSDCVGGSCSGSMCLATCSDQVKNANETDVDCGGPQCPVCADGQTCAVGSDCSTLVCSDGACQTAGCSDMVKNGAETDVDCGGPACPGCGDNLACSANEDCSSLVCSGGACAAATCSDAVQNGGESDIDCGGAACPDCGDGKACGAGSDCASGVCQANQCKEASCSDGVKNQQETDIDCGGSCKDCAILKACAVDGDCVSGICLNSVCQAPTCGDSVKNGTETDVDCGGAGCMPCADGKACTVLTDCLSGGCSSGVCPATVCGDGLKAVSEQCDDANTAAGDCCSATCSIESNCEVEINNTPQKSILTATFPASGLIKARIQPVGDIDYLAVNLTAITDLRIETAEGFAPGFCSGIDTVIELIGPNGSTIIASDDDDSPNGNCSLIDPAGADTGARQLPPGTYYVRVIEYGSNAVINAYSVILTAVATCGNGIKEGSEQCDDGNQNPADNCTNLCKVNTTPEAEANNTCATANGPVAASVGGSPIFSGAITPVADQDWYAFTVPATADVIFETFDANGPGSCVSTDTEIQVFKSDCVTALGAAKDQGSIGNCSKLAPAVDAQVRHIPAGTYYMRVNEFGNNATLAGYTVQATITALCGNGVLEGYEECDGGAMCDANCDRIAVCGDGLVDAPETCDDANLGSGDGCDAACLLEPGYVCSPAGGSPCVTACGDAMIVGNEQCDDGNRANGDGCDSACASESPPAAEVEPNNTFAESDLRALDLPPILITGNSTTISGAITPVGDKDYFKLVVATDSVIRFEMFDSTGVNCPTGMTTSLRIFNATQVQVVAELASAAGGGINGCAALVTFLAAGTYYVQAEETGNNATVATYKLQIRTQSSAGAEAEVNDTRQAANPLGGPPFEIYVAGDHTVSTTDSDFYQIIVPNGRSLRAEVIEGDLTETCESNGVDSLLTFYDAAGVLQAENDDDGRGRCSIIDGTGTTTPFHPKASNLPGGIYYLQVRAYSLAAAPAATFKYRLAITVR